MSEPAATTPETATPTPADAFAAFEASENANAAAGVQPAAVTEPTPSADPDDEPEPAATPAPAAAAAAPEKAVSKRQAHINELTRKATEADQRAEKLAAEIAALKAKPAAAAPVTEPAAEPKPAAIVDPNDPEPDEAKFDDYRDFTKALAKWTVRQDRREEAAATAQAKEAESSAAAEKDAIEKFNAWTTRRDAFIAKTPSATERLSTFLASVETNTPIGDTILESEVGAEVADYLSQRLDEAERIARLAPAAALRALGKLESTFTPTHASARAQPAAKLVTTAPAPPTTLAARSADHGDPAKAAVDRGDFSAFEAEENRRALAG